MILPQLLVNGIIAGAIYALVAASFALVFNILKFMDLSPGALFVIGAFATYGSYELTGNLIISIIFGLFISCIFGVLINLIVYKPLRKRKADSFTFLLSSFAIFLFLTGLVLLFFGAEVKSFSLEIERGYEIFGIIITKLQIILIVVSLILFAGLQMFMTKTKIGKALRAISDNPKIASTLGINTEKFTNITFIISSFLAGAAGILVSLEQNLDHAMGFSIVLKGITASVVGGIGSVPAALLGGFLIGIVENLGIWFLPSGFKDAIAFVILILFLMFRPRGLFGIKTREEGSG